jgi:glucose-6-phosphate 1-dehydrogenase
MKTSTISRPADSCALVIFGGNGDLAWRKLVPSLFNLHIDKSLPEKMAIIAVDRADIDDAALRKRLRVGVKKFAANGQAARLAKLRSAPQLLSRRFSRHIGRARHIDRLCQGAIGRIA